VIPSLDRLEPSAAERGPRPSTWFFRILVLFVFGALTAQMWRLQVVDGQAYYNRSSANWLRQAVIPPQRGVIYDRNRALLAANAPIFVVSITPADIPKGRMQEIVIRVANELRVPPGDIQRVIDTRQTRKDYNAYNSIPISSNVDREAVMRISERQLEMPGVAIGVESTRRYTEGPLIAHIIGYMGAISADQADQLQQEGYGLDYAGPQVNGRTRSRQADRRLPSCGARRNSRATTWCCPSISSCSGTLHASFRKACAAHLAVRLS
jgi:penicillin-binding protein 2